MSDWHQFQYSVFPFQSAAAPGSVIIRRPLLEVELDVAKRRIRCKALLDTGADHCLFPISFIEHLGLDRRALPTTRAAGLAATGTEVFHAPVTISFAPDFVLTPTVGFSEAMEQAQMCVLGQIGFLEYLDVTFQSASGIFLIRKAPLVNSGFAL